ncbi:hypothetical protein ACFSKL_06095 [Belliella marina]|uniref:MORN repeat variant n=1 Tax=Belliella marina TaxID=1644146 RepID=A0ABW4VI53_9BACT
MKHLLFCLLFLGLFFCQKVEGQQYFEGYIHYTYEYFTLEGEDISNQKQEFLPKEQHYYIKEGNYVAFDHDGELMQLYNQGGNAYYYQRGEILYKMDAGSWLQGEEKYTEGKEKLKVLKYRCKSVEKEGSVTFYSKKVRVDPASFESHTFGNWARYLDFTNGALALKIVNTHGDYYQVITASKVVPMKLDDEKFDLDKILGAK